MKAVFRVDASLEMGSGHVMRCLTLADELTRCSFKCVFISRKQSGDLTEAIKERGYDIYELPECKTSTDTHLTHSHWLKGCWEKDAEESEAVLKKLESDWLVVDHYGIDESWEQKLRGNVRNILVIDDLADRKHACDVLIDQNLGQTDALYRLLVPQDCLILTGSQYAMLRPEFVNYRQRSLEYRNGKTQIERVLITMGGVDKGNHTQKALNALNSSDLPDKTEVIVVLGKQSIWFAQVKSHVARSRLNIRVLSNVSNMAELMSRSDLAIGAAGSTSWERCCLGLPTLMFILADNQKGIAKALEGNGAAMLVSQKCTETSLREKISILLAQPELLLLLSASASQLVDGRGVERVVQRMSKRVE